MACALTPLGSPAPALRRAGPPGRSPHATSSALRRGPPGRARWGAGAAPRPRAPPPPQAVRIEYHQLELPTKLGIALFDITPQVQGLIDEAGMKEGSANILSRHTTTALTINEMEERLVDDVRQYLVKLAPPGDPYLHNDIHLRDGPPDWPGGNEAWRAQEPVNAHSHLLSMLLGNSETVPFTNGRLCIGTWQSIILVELDGPRDRTVGVQLIGE